MSSSRDREPDARQRSSLETARQVAWLRAAYCLRPADALHIATALLHGATTFVTNDRDLTRVDEVQVVLVIDLVH